LHNAQGQLEKHANLGYSNLLKSYELRSLVKANRSS